MPETKKKPAAPKPRGSGRKLPEKKPAVRREVWAGIFLLLSLMAFLDFFGLKGALLDWYGALVGSLIGSGAALMPFALLAGGCMLIYKRKGKARLRVGCIMLLPVFLGSIVHLVRDVAVYESGLTGMGQLAKHGREAMAAAEAMPSGGLISGGFAMLWRWAISKPGAVILFVMLMASALAVATSFNPKAIWRKLQAMRPLPEPEEEPRPEPEPAPRKTVKVPKPVPRSGIDIALDETDVHERTPNRFAEGPLAPPNVPTPAEALRGAAEAEKAAAAPKSMSRKDPTELIEPRFDSSQAELDLPGTIEPEPIPEPEPMQDSPDLEDDLRAEDELPVEQQLRQALEGGEAPVYLYPPLTLLKPGSGRPQGMEAAAQACAARLLDTLQSFNIEASLVDITAGPTVTRYELMLQRGTKFAKVSSLSDDIALALGAVGVRVTTIPDKNAVGIEVPNEQQELVTARDVLGAPAFKNSESRLSFAVGRDITGDVVVGDIAKMPHMLIAGTTGSGKSVCINSLLISLLYKATPEEVRLIMIDPKMIELGVYNGIPHLLIPVVTDPRKAAGALNWAVSEMMKRYQLFSEVGTRDLKSYNRLMSEREEGERLPQIVIVIDELSDLMVAARAEVEEAIIRIAQMARAAGMHLIIATQRPSADVITGLMKANIPSRIAFAVASAVNSRIVLDQMGAEKLLGKGDMLYAPLGGGNPQRIQGCFVTDREVEEVVAFIKQLGQADYDDDILNHIERQAEAASSGGSGGGAVDGGGLDADDELLGAAIEIVVESGQASVSMLQRRLKLGYSRAARLVDIMEERGIVGAFEGSKPRQVLISRDDWKEMVLRRQD